MRVKVGGPSPGEWGMACKSLARMGAPRHRHRQEEFMHLVDSSIAVPMHAPRPLPPRVLSVTAQAPAPRHGTVACGLRYCLVTLSCRRSIYTLPVMSCKLTKPSPYLPSHVRRCRPGQGG